MGALFHSPPSTAALPPHTTLYRRQSVTDFRRCAPPVVTSAIGFLIAHTSIDVSASAPASISPKIGTVAAVATPRLDSAPPAVSLTPTSDGAVPRTKLLLVIGPGILGHAPALPPSLGHPGPPASHGLVTRYGTCCGVSQHPRGPRHRARTAITSIACRYTAGCHPLPRRVFSAHKIDYSTSVSPPTRHYHHCVFLASANLRQASQNVSSLPHICACVERALLSTNGTTHDQRSYYIRSTANPCSPLHPHCRLLWASADHTTRKAATRTSTRHSVLSPSPTASATMPAYMTCPSFD